MKLDNIRAFVSFYGESVDTKTSHEHRNAFKDNDMSTRWDVHLWTCTDILYIDYHRAILEL